MKKALSTPAPLDMYIVLDVAEKVVLLCLFVAVCVRILPDIVTQYGIIDVCILVSEGSVVVFTMTHRLTRTMSLRPADWIFTAAGTFLPMLVAPGGAGPAVLLPVGAALMSAGLLLEIMAKFTLRRSFGLGPANRGVKVGGPYRLIRHPMYAGYVLTHIAFLTAHPTLWNACIYAAAFAAQCRRILAEERILGDDETYRAFMKTTRYRLLPLVF